MVAVLLVSAVRAAELKDQRLEFKNIELKDTAFQIKLQNEKIELYEKKLEEAKGNEAKLKKLEEQSKKDRVERERLRRELQAKKEAKSRLANQGQNVAYAARSAGGDCSSWISAAGISDVASANELIRRESNCNPNAVNPSSGACGVAQELPCGKSGCSLGDGACQVKWMNSYVIQRYGSWSSAVAFHNANNWY